MLILKRITRIAVIGTFLYAGSVYSAESSVHNEADNHETHPAAGKKEKRFNHPGFDAFWKTFRARCMSEKYEEIIPLVHFPLMTRGPMDYHPEIAFAKSEFEKVFRLFLSQPTGMDMELKETIFDDIKNKESVLFSHTKGPLMSDGWARVNDMEFKKADSEWKLVFIYLDSETYETVGIEIE